MNSSNKGTLRHLLVIPAIIVLVTLLILACLFPVFKTFIPASNKIVANAAMTQDSELKPLYDGSVKPDSGKISLTTVSTPRENEIIGEIITPSGTSIHLLFGQNDLTLANGAGLDMNTPLIGASGTSYLFGYNSESACRALLNVKKNDRLRIRTYYGEYSFTVTDVRVVHSKNEIDAAAYSGNGVVIYTNYPVKTGLTDDYYVVHAVRESGPELTR